MTDRVYARMSGYAPTSVKDEALEQWRTGRAAANPAEAQALVREIDRLRAAVTPAPYARHQHAAGPGGACMECGEPLDDPEPFV